MPFNGSLCLSKTDLNPVVVLLTVLRRFLCCSSCLCVSGFICGVCVDILVPHLFFFWCLENAVLHDCGISWVSFLSIFIKKKKRKITGKVIIGRLS